MSVNGFSKWGATQDRFGGDVTTISDQAKSWVEAANVATDSSRNLLYK